MRYELWNIETALANTRLELAGAAESLKWANGLKAFVDEVDMTGNSP